MIVTAFLFTALASVPAAPQDNPNQGPPKRVRSVILYGEDECPKAQDPEEIVVCAKSGESPYRIPKEFRNQPSDDAAAQAWTNRVETVEQLNRAGLPNSCSPIGSQGQTGCTRQMIQQWAQERLNQRAKSAPSGQ